MKKMLLTLAVCFTVGALIAQTSNNVNVVKSKHLKPENTISTKSYKVWAKAPESGIPFNTGNIMTRTSTRSGAAVGTRIGTTTYDLQTNSAEPNRIHVDAAGNVSATWTGSVELASGWADRGAFYNYYDGSAWGAEPTSRIETVRTGWPELVRNGTNDVVFSHDPGGFGYTLVNTSVAGSGAWQEIQPSGNLEGIWPRAAANGSYIYMINANYQSAAGNNYVQYYRSADGGNSFDIMQEGLPGIDTASGYSVMGGDSYQIIARDSIVAIVAANSVNDLAVWISHSNGDLGTFNRTRILDFPIDNFDGNVISDVNGDNVPDTLDTNDGSHTVLVDNSGKVHIWSGATRVLDDTPGDDGWSFFPGVSGIWYWNEDFGADSVWLLDVLIDWDQSGIAGDGIGADIPNYGVGLTSMLSATIDPSTGRMYLMMAMPVENTDFFEDPSNPAAQSFRDLFGTYTDDGLTYSPVVNLTRDAENFMEHVYPSAMKTTVGQQIHITYMRDEEPGNALEADAPDPIVENEIIYVGFDYNRFEPYTPDALFTADYPGYGPSVDFTNNSTDASSYTWDFGDATGSFSENPTHNYTANGTYTVCLTATNFYGTDDYCEDVTIMNVGIEDVALDNSIEMFPNPTAGEVNVTIANSTLENVTISVFNIIGEQVLENVEMNLKANNKANIDLSNLDAGNYFVKFQSENAVATRQITLSK